MAWRSSGPSNKALIDNLEQNGLIETQRVKDAMLQVLPTTILVSRQGEQQVCNRANTWKGRSRTLCPDKALR
jgi:hypothetical protein